MKEGRKEGEKDRREETGEGKQNHKPKTSEGYTLGESITQNRRNIKKKFFCGLNENKKNMDSCKNQLKAEHQRSTKGFS